MTTKPSTIPEGTKWCHACKQVHGHMNFATDSTRKDGLRNKCKPCDHRARTVYNRRKALAKQSVLVTQHLAKSADWVKDIAAVQARAKATKAMPPRPFDRSAMMASSAARTAART